MQVALWTHARRAPMPFPLIEWQLQLYRLRKVMGSKHHHLANLPSARCAILMCCFHTCGGAGVGPRNLQLNVRARLSTWFSLSTHGRVGRPSQRFTSYDKKTTIIVYGANIYMKPVKDEGFETEHAHKPHSNQARHARSPNSSSANQKSFPRSPNPARNAGVDRE